MVKVFWAVIDVFHQGTFDGWEIMIHWATFKWKFWSWGKERCAVLSLFDHLHSKTPSCKAASFNSSSCDNPQALCLYDMVWYFKLKTVQQRTNTSFSILQLIILLFMNTRLLTKDSFSLIKIKIRIKIRDYRNTAALIMKKPKEKSLKQCKCISLRGEAQCL